MSRHTRKSVLLATIGAPHGVRGEVRVKTFTEDPAALAQYGPLRAEDGRSFEIERVRPGKNMVTAKLRGVDHRGAAEALNGLSLYVDRESLPPAEEDEFYHADLIGLSAKNKAGERIGTVVAVHNFGAGDILEIAPPRGQSFMVPFTKAAVPNLDVAGGHIVVLLPAELAGETADQEEIGS